MSRQIKAASDVLGDKNFFGGDKPCYADFNMFHYLDNLDTLLPDSIDHENLKEWFHRVATLEEISAYLKERPQLGSCDVGRPGSAIQDPSRCSTLKSQCGFA